LTWVISQNPLVIQNMSMEQRTKAEKKELGVLVNFVRIYCEARHGDQLEAKGETREISGSRTLLCRECADLVEYAMEKLRRCPLTPKPSCKKCHIHCYGREQRTRIREIMAFSGRRMILQGRLHYLRHYLF
jgi:hypothetical protein